MQACRFSRALLRATCAGLRPRQHLLPVASTPLMRQPLTRRRAPSEWLAALTGCPFSSKCPACHLVVLVPPGTGQGGAIGGQGGDLRGTDLAGVSDPTL